MVSLCGALTDAQRSEISISTQSCLSKRNGISYVYSNNYGTHEAILPVHPVSPECSLDVRRRVLERDPGLLVALRDPLVEQLCDPQELLFAGSPNANHDGARGDACTGTCVLRRSLFRGFVEMLLDTLEQRIDVLPDVLCIVLLDHLLECRLGVTAVRRNLRRCSCLE